VVGAETEETLRIDFHAWQGDLFSWSRCLYEFCPFLTELESLQKEWSAMPTRRDACPSCKPDPQS
jgi:hypothetical protein